MCDRTDNQKSNGMNSIYIYMDDVWSRWIKINNDFNLLVNALNSHCIVKLHTKTHTIFSGLWIVWTRKRRAQLGWWEKNIFRVVKELKIWMAKRITHTTLTPLGRLPSMASFLLRQSAHKNGPCQGLELVEKMAPACTEIPSLGARSTWQMAQVKRPDVDGPVVDSLPSLNRKNHSNNLWVK